MANITVTPELASIIKRERTNANPKLSAKELSLAIEKSDTYISTLERGNIKKLDSKLFINIFRKIKICSDAEFQNYINTILNDAFTSIKYNEKELKKQEWILQLSLVMRKIPISANIITFIKESLAELNLTDIDLIRKTNANTYLPNPEKLEYNTLKIDDDGLWSYKYKLSDNTINDIVTSKAKTCNFIIMLGIIYNIYLLQGNDNASAQKNANKFLFDNKFYNLNQIYKVRKAELEKTADKENPYSFALPEYESEFSKTLANLKQYITQFRDMNVDSALSMITTVENNLKLDAQFMNVIYKIPFYKLFKDFNVQQKQNFLSKLRTLIDETIEENKANTYDEIGD